VEERIKAIESDVKELTVQLRALRVFMLHKFSRLERPPMTAHSPHVCFSSKQAMGGEGLPACPLCGSRRVIRVNRATGDEFFGCSNYPDCMFSESISNASVSAPMVGCKVGAIDSRTRVSADIFDDWNIDGDEDVQQSVDSALLECPSDSLSEAIKDVEKALSEF
jgi:hypothetical protein